MRFKPQLAVAVWLLCQFQPQIAWGQTERAASFDQILSWAVVKSPKLSEADSKVRSKHAIVEGKIAQRYPTFSATTNALNNTGGSSVTLKANMPVWSFGKVDASIDLASAEMAYEVAGRALVKNNVLSEAAQTYVDIYYIQEKVKVAKLNVIEHESILKRIQRQRRAGAVGEADVRTAQSRLLSAKNQVNSLEGELIGLRDELRVITDSADISQVSEIPFSWLMQQRGLINLEQLINKNPEVSRTQAEIKVAELRLLVAAREGYPNVYLDVERDLGKSNAAYRNRVGLKMDVAIKGAGVVNDASLREAEELLEAVKASGHTVRNQIARDFKSWAASSAELESIIRSQSEVVVSLEETVRSALRRLDGGRMSWIEVLNFQRELNEARIQLLQYQGNWTSRIMSMVNLGGLLESRLKVPA